MKKSIIAAAAGVLTMGSLTLFAPIASAGGPCTGAGLHTKACSDCVINNGNNLASSEACGVEHDPRPLCEQAGVCG